MIDKELPKNIAVEKAVLGSFILESSLYYEYPLREEHFYLSEHVIVFKAIEELATKGMDIDLLTVTTQCRSMGFSDPLFITGLTTNIALTIHIATHVGILIENQYRRESIVKAAEIARSCYDMSSDIDNIQSKASELAYSAVNLDDNSVSVCSDVKKEIVEKIAHNRTRKEGEFSGIGTGFIKFDNFTHGLQKGDLVILAGASSMGKTSKALNIVSNSVLKYGAKAAIFSMEMRNTSLMSRIAGSSIGISSKKLNNEPLSIEEEVKYLDIIDSFGNDNLFFIEKPSLTIENITATMRKLAIKSGVQIFVIDFLQRLICPHKYTKNDFYALVSQRLKDVAMELGVTVILLSQLNKGGHGQDQEPTLDRLRGSGEIAEAADIVLLMYRPEYYKIDSIDYNGQQLDSTGLAWAIIAKGRETGIGQYLLKWNPQLTLFSNYEEEDKPYEYGKNNFATINRNDGFESEKQDTPF